MEKNSQYKMEYWVRYQQTPCGGDNCYTVLTFSDFESAHEIYESIRNEMIIGLATETFVEIILIIQDTIFSRLISYGKK